MFARLHRWAVEVDTNRERRDPRREAVFISEFGKALYDSIGDPASPLRSLHHVYFTRIFRPKRDDMGSYVRLHFFVEEGRCASATQELRRRLERMRSAGKVYKVREETINGIAEARRKGAEGFPGLYYTYVEQISRIAVELFGQDISQACLGTVLKEWTHNLHNLLRGQ